MQYRIRILIFLKNSHNLLSSFSLLEKLDNIIRMIYPQCGSIGNAISFQILEGKPKSTIFFPIKISHIILL